MNFKQAKRKWFNKRVYTFEANYYAADTYGNNYAICKYENNELNISCYPAIKKVEYIKSKLLSFYTNSSKFFYLRSLELKSKDSKERVIVYLYTHKELEKSLNFKESKTNDN